MSDERKPISPETLHALVDGEFSTEESAQLMARVRSQDHLRQQACDIRMLKDMVRLAYRDVPPPRRHPSREAGGARAWLAAAAAALLLLGGVMLGWQLHAPGGVERFVVLDPDGRGAAPATRAQEETRIVFHLTNPDMTVAGELLHDVEILLQEYEHDGLPLRVEIVAHGDGLGLLQENLSAHKAQIHAMAQRYLNLTFVACKNTIDRLEVENGVELVLLPEASVVASGVDYVVRRQREGWAYIRV